MLTLCDRNILGFLDEEQIVEPFDRGGYSRGSSLSGCGLSTFI